jgi:hypothetical protein
LSFSCIFFLYDAVILFNCATSKDPATDKLPILNYFNSEGFWWWYITLSITGFLDSIHCLVFQTEHVSEPGFVSVLAWKGEEAPVQLDIISSTVPKQFILFRILSDGQVQKPCNINSNIFSFLPNMFTYFPFCNFWHILYTNQWVSNSKCNNDMRHYGFRTAKLHFFYQLCQNTVAGPGSMSLQEIVSSKFASDINCVQRFWKKFAILIIKDIIGVLTLYEYLVTKELYALVQWVPENGFILSMSAHIKMSVSCALTNSHLNIRIWTMM